MIKLITKSLTAILLTATVASCSTTSYSTLKADEVQLAGHKYKTAKDCERKAPIGKFDDKCDIPLLAWRGAQSMESVTPSVGGNSSGGVSF